MKRSRIKPRNDARAARMRERNFPTPPAVAPFCAIARKLQEYQRRHGAKMIPAGWSRCRGVIDPAHVVCARGMGGVNSSAAEVAYLCRGHHDEQEGRSEEFERRYNVNLKQLAAEREAAADEGPPI